MNPARILLILIPILFAGCQLRDVTAPVEDPAIKLTGPGWCTHMFVRSADFIQVDSGTTCQNGSPAQAVGFTRPRLPNKTCGESIWAPAARTTVHYGCRANLPPRDTIRI